MEADELSGSYREGFWLESKMGGIIHTLGLRSSIPHHRVCHGSYCPFPDVDPGLGEVKLWVGGCPGAVGRARVGSAPQQGSAAWDGPWQQGTGV